MSRTAETNRWLAVALCVALLAGCSTRDGELEEFIAATKKMDGDKVEPLREFQPYEPHAYSAGDKRSPFVPGGSGGANAAMRPVVTRNREFLEQFALDTLQMVGTLTQGGRQYGLLKVRDGRVQRVSVGNYIGQNDGKINAITDKRIELTEVVADGLGGYIERPASIAISE